MNLATDIWGEDAAVFKPERWLSPMPDSIEEMKGFTVYSHLLTFLGGSRACIGYRFALRKALLIVELLSLTRLLAVEFKAVLAILIESFEYKECVYLHAYRMSRLTLVSLRRPDKPVVVKKSSLVTRPYLKEDMQAGSQMPLLVSFAE